MTSPASAQAPAKQTVCGVEISKTNYDEVVRLCESWIRERRTPDAQAWQPRRARYICVTSVHGVISAQEDREFMGILNDATIATPDGMPLVWAIRSFGEKRQDRVYGPTLMLRLCEQAAAKGHRVFLYGGRTETLPVLEKRLLEKFPTLKLAGSYSPPFRPLTPEEDRDVQQKIRAADPDLIFVGISTPKQERWMYDHRDSFPGVIMAGVGAAFDFHAGRVKQAPSWMQRNGLEWLFRLVAEPRRLWKRYLLVTPKFLPLWALQKLGWRRYPVFS